MPRSPHDKLTVAVVGATGAVGRTMLQVLTEKPLPYTELRLLASERSAGRTVTVAGTKTAAIGPAPITVSDGSVYTAAARDATGGGPPFGLILMDEFVP